MFFKCTFMVMGNTKHLLLSAKEGSKLDILRAKLYFSTQRVNFLPARAARTPPTETKKKLITLKKKRSERIVKDEECPPFKHMKPEDTLLTKLVVNAKNRRERYKKGLIMLEGKRLVQEALDADVKPKIICFSRKSTIVDLRIPEEYNNPTERTVLYHLPYNSIQLWSQLKTSPGIFGVFEMPDLSVRIVPKGKFGTPLPLTIVCDNIREPGNLGAIIRLAAALPVQNLITTQGCVDLWDPKVTRGSCGGIFKLNILNDVNWEQIEDLCRGDVILADNKTSLTCYSPPEEDDDESNDGEKEQLRRNIEECRRKIPFAWYHDIDYARDENIHKMIIVGGETTGLSLEAFLFAINQEGFRISIPISENVESLNSVAAMSVLTFEIKRQFMLKYPKYSETPLMAEHIQKEWADEIDEVDSISLQRE